MSRATDAFVKALNSLPVGSFTGTAHGRRYIASKTTYSADKSVKLVAEELGGRDYISLNLYRLSDGARLYPCEMPLQKVVAFIRAFVTDQEGAA
ncbi:MAG: hypothetical protein AAF636_22440 [Pseudomonadota bacterium]